MPLEQCARCRRVSSRIASARAVGAYEGTLRKIVHAMKYEGRRSLARPLAGLMSDRGSRVLDGADVVVPVPLHPARKRERGFNQAADLAAHLALRPVHGLRRVRATETQAALPAGRRHRNVWDAFAPTRASLELRGLVAVLVDDVSTTGATLEACARALQASRAREIRALTVARVVRQRR